MRSRLLAALAILLLAACAPLRQGPGQPALGFPGPRLEQDAFVSFDGTRLGLQQWDAEGEPWAVIIGLHGMNDYANTFDLAGPWWAARGVTTYAYDQRGFGRSPNRGIWPERGLMGRDLQTMVALVKQRHPHALIALAGVSMGGAVAIEAMSGKDPPPVDRVVLLSPAVWGWSTQPLDYKIALWVAAHTVPGLQLNPPSFVTSKIAASDNLEELRRMGRDPNLLFGARPDALYGLVGLMERAYQDTGRLKAPTFYAYGGRDQIIPRRAAFAAAARLPSRDRTAYYEDDCHLMLIDLEGQQVWGDVLSFLKDPKAPLPSGVGPIPKPTSQAAQEKAPRCIPRLAGSAPAPAPAP